MRKDEFFIQVAQAMSGCQAVEQALKLYLAEAFEAVRLRVAALMPFKMSGTDYENAPLERLIEIFANAGGDRANERHGHGDTKRLLAPVDNVPLPELAYRGRVHPLPVVLELGEPGLSGAVEEVANLCV